MFVIDVTWNNSERYETYRRYSDFFSFQVRQSNDTLLIMMHQSIFTTTLFLLHAYIDKLILVNEYRVAMILHETTDFDSYTSAVLKDVPLFMIADSKFHSVPCQHDCSVDLASYTSLTLIQSGFRSLLVTDNTKATVPSCSGKDKAGREKYPSTSK